MLQLFSTPEKRTPHCKGQKILSHWCPLNRGSTVDDELVEFKKTRDGTYGMAITHYNSFITLKIYFHIY